MSDVLEAAKAACNMDVSSIDAAGSQEFQDDHTTSIQHRLYLRSRIKGSTSHESTFMQAAKVEICGGAARVPWVKDEIGVPSYLSYLSKLSL